MATQPLISSANKQASGAKKSRLQNATELQQITSNEASGAGLLPGIEKIHCKMQQISIGTYPCKPLWSPSGGRKETCS